MACEPPPELQGAAGDMPAARIDGREADRGPDTGGGDVAPARVPPDAPVGADLAPREAVRGRERGPGGGQLPGGGLVAGGGGAQVARLRRPCMVERGTAVGELPRLGAAGGAGWSAGVGLQGALQPRLAAVLGRLTGFEARRSEAQAHPPGGYLAAPGPGGGGERPAGVGAAALRQAAGVAHPRAHRVGLLDAGGGEGLARAQNAAVALGEGQGIAGAAVPGLEGAVEGGAPHRVGGPPRADGLASMPAHAAPARLGHQAVAAADGTDGRAGRPRPAGVACAAA
jgi:hypothetical protein